MIASRRAARPTPAVDERPSESGPRCTSVADMAASRSRSTRPRAETTPQIPHTRSSLSPAFRRAFRPSCPGTDGSGRWRKVAPTRSVHTAGVVGAECRCPRAGCTRRSVRSAAPRRCPAPSIPGAWAAIGACRRPDLPRMSARVRGRERPASLEPVTTSVLAAQPAEPAADDLFRDRTRARRPQRRRRPGASVTRCVELIGARTVADAPGDRIVELVARRDRADRRSRRAPARTDATPRPTARCVRVRRLAW